MTALVNTVCAVLINLTTIRFKFVSSTAAIQNVLNLVVKSLTEVIILVHNIYLSSLPHNTHKFPKLHRHIVKFVHSEIAILP